MYGEVREIHQLTPAMTRLVFGGGDLTEFEPTQATDAYLKAQFLPLGATYEVPFEIEDLDGVTPEHLPRARRYTVRRWNPDTHELTIDFTTHGDTGYAGAWANRAQVGDRIQFTGPRGNYRPRTDVDWHLFVGDESVLPAIAASLEVLEAGDRAVVVAVVDAPGYEVDLGSVGEVDIQWLYRSESETPETLLLDALAEMQFPDGSFDTFVHGEAGETRSVRKFLISERGVDPSEASISAYWRRTLTDEQWRAIKKDWNEAQEADV